MGRWTIPKRIQCAFAKATAHKCGHGYGAQVRPRLRRTREDLLT